MTAVLLWRYDATVATPGMRAYARRSTIRAPTPNARRRYGRPGLRRDRPRPDHDPRGRAVRLARGCRATGRPGRRTDGSRSSPRRTATPLEWRRQPARALGVVGRRSSPPRPRCSRINSAGPGPAARSSRCSPAPPSPCSHPEAPTRSVARWRSSRSRSGSTNVIAARSCCSPSPRSAARRCCCSRSRSRRGSCGRARPGLAMRLTIPVGVYGAWVAIVFVRVGALPSTLARVALGLPFVGLFRAMGHWSPLSTKVA